MEQWLASETIFEGRVFSVKTGTTILANGARAQRDIVEHAGGVTIVPLYGSELILVRNFRIAIDDSLLELPAGMLEPDEDPRDCAARELREETGFRAGRLDLLADYYVSPGYTTERMRIFLARDLTPTEQALEDDEQLEIVRLPLDAVLDLLDGGDIRDAKTIIGLRELQVFLA